MGQSNFDINKFMEEQDNKEKLEAEKKQKMKEKFTLKLNGPKEIVIVTIAGIIILIAVVFAIYYIVDNNKNKPLENNVVENDVSKTLNELSTIDNSIKLKDLKVKYDKDRNIYVLSTNVCAYKNYTNLNIKLVMDDDEAVISIDQIKNGETLPYEIEFGNDVSNAKNKSIEIIDIQ